MRSASSPWPLLSSPLQLLWPSVSHAPSPAPEARYFLLISSIQFSSVQLLSCVWLFETPWIAARQASLSITNSRSSLRLTSIKSVVPSSHLILGCPLVLLPPSIRVFSNESTLCMRWPKYWSFSFSIIPSKGGGKCYRKFSLKKTNENEEWGWYNFR